MEGLRAERDELDQYSQRQKKALKGNNKHASSSSGGGRVAGLWFIALVLLGASSLLGWGYLKQQTTLKALESDLLEASYFINQSKLLMARFEGKLNDAGMEMESSGSVVDKKLAFLDSEMRKLWGVSNDRNKKSIQMNEKAISALKGQISHVDKQLTSASTAAKAEASARKAEQSKLAKQVSSLDTIVKSTAGEVAITREIINEEIDLMNLAIESSEALRGFIDENKKAIASIDASRLQLNERVINLESQLNQLRLELQQAKKQAKPLSSELTTSSDLTIEMQ